MKKLFGYAKCFLAHPTNAEIDLFIFNVMAAIFPAIFMVDWYLWALVVAADIVVCMAHGAYSFQRKLEFRADSPLVRQTPPWQTPVNSCYRFIGLGCICLFSSGVF